MVETQFTPGPYSQHPYSTLEPMLVRGGDSHGAFHFASIGIGSGDKLIAEVRYEKGATGGFPQVEDMTEFRANAALFIAAPCMLEALEWIDGEAPTKEPHDGPTVGFQSSGDPEDDDGNETVAEAFREGVARGLWLAAEQARPVIAKVLGK